MFTGRLWSLGCLLLSIVVMSHSLSPEVKTTHGILRGTTIDGTNVFRGVPYALPPVGLLRYSIYLDTQ